MDTSMPSQNQHAVTRPAITPAIIGQLEAIVGKEGVETNKEELLCYSYDGTGQESVPEAVVFPENTQHVAAIMKLAHANRIPVVPRGAGSGMTGGSVPLQGGLVLAMARMNHILELDRANQIAVVEPGVITGNLRKRAAQDHLFYPVDPASVDFCTMGGNVAECAGGPSAVKYGVTRDYILGLEVVLADGRILETGVRTNKGVVGYDLTRLFTGSEGTLGVITKIIVRLIGQPTATRTTMLLFDDLQSAAALVSELLIHHTPAKLEYLDQTALAIVADKLPEPLPASTQAMLIIELDGDPESVDIQGRRLDDFLRDQPHLLHQATATDPRQAKRLWLARKQVSPSAFKLRPDKISEDVVVPKTKIPDLVRVTETLAKEMNLIIFTFGHAGDGNIHVNIMVDKTDPMEYSRGRQAKEELFKTVLSLGGTLSGEHGIGNTKAEHIGLELSATSIAVMTDLKNLFDPLHILNPGKIFQ
jgi:glycolate oxidase